MSALSSSAGARPEAAPGSTRYFVLLYCALARREALATLLAVADEIGAGLDRAVDHSVAHVRLEWWRQELRRFALGQPQHPWLVAWLQACPADRSLELEGLTEAAAIDLASARLGGRQEYHLLGAVFILVAKLLGLAAPSAAVEHSIRELGRYTAELEQRASAGAAPGVEPAAQPSIAPLLVWSALARARVRRRERRAGSSAAAIGRFDVLADNFVAWRAARQAVRGRYRGG